MTDLHTEIDAILKKTEECWNSQNWHHMIELWDEDDPEPIYVAEELYQPMIGWDIIRPYFRPPGKGLEAFRWGYSNLFVKQLAPDIALALFSHWFELKLAHGQTQPRAGFDRVLALYRKKSDGWKQIMYAQCPLGPDTYVRALCEKIVQPDFAEFAERAKLLRKAVIDGATEDK